MAKKHQLRIDVLIVRLRSNWMDLDHADQLEQTDLLSPVEIGGYNRVSVFYKGAYKCS